MFHSFFSNIIFLGGMEGVRTGKKKYLLSFSLWPVRVDSCVCNQFATVAEEEEEPDTHTHSHTCTHSHSSRRSNPKNIFYTRVTALQVGLAYFKSFSFAFSGQLCAVRECV